MKRFISILLIVVLVLPGSLAASPGAFPDVPRDAIYYEAVTELSGLCELGYPDGTFRPDELVTRAEFVAMLLKAFKNPDLADAKRDQIFVDVPVTNWANQYITLAFDDRLVDGCGDGIFMPNATIHYEDMLKITIQYLLEGRRGGIRYPDGYIEIAGELGIALPEGALGQDAKRGQVARLLYAALTVEEEALQEQRDKYTLSGGSRESYGAGGGGGTGGSVGAPAPSVAIMEDAVPTMSFTDSVEDTAFDSDIAVMPASPDRPGEGDGYDAQMQISAGLLTAGEWNDNENWVFWNQLMANREWHRMQSRWEIPANSRYAVSVTDDGTPVIGATVVLAQGDTTLWSAVTDIDGMAFVFAVAEADEQNSAFSLHVATSSDSKTIDDVVLTDDRPYEVELAQGEIEDSIDVLLMVDTTGSMGDELQYLKEELSDVVQRITADVRVSCNFYRDIGDEYIVRPFDFTTDVDEAVTQISAQRASGGGDYPEAVEVALLNAIDEHDWNPNAKERFLFLVLDAPPHYDAARVETLNECIKRAAEQGVRIIPVASSGVDKETEFLLRGMSIVTNGTYVFLTDHSGIGNRHLEPTIGAYEVQFLNDLMVQIINSRI